MCGIVGFSGKNAVSKVLEGLKRLEYRGYDSWGIGYIESNSIELIKNTGKVSEITLENIESNFAIGHTRWATHGGVSVANAHPHFSTDKSFILAQNGIFENYAEVKEELLKKGYTFVSETDTEVIVRLIEENLKSMEFMQAIVETFKTLKGRNTIIVLKNNGEIFAIRNGSPLVLGVSGDFKILSSDTLSFSNLTNKALILDNHQMVYIKDNAYKVFDITTECKQIEKEVTVLDYENTNIDKEGFDHFMIKEIFDQTHTVKDAVQYSLKELQPLIDKIKQIRKVFFVGAGTAGNAAAQIAYFFRKYTNIDAVELVPYESETYLNNITKDDFLFAISQSGETADTIEVVESFKQKGGQVGSIVNMVGSSLTRISDYKFLSRTGPEVCVASTKAYTAQLSFGLVLALSVANKYDYAISLIGELSTAIKKFLTAENINIVKDIVKKLEYREHFFILGRGQNFVTAKEGALKIKEITYKHFEAFSAGELKHGVIALIENDTPVITVLSNDLDSQTALNAAEQVKSRGAYTIGIVKSGNNIFEDQILLPDLKEADSIINIIPFQLISYYLGVKLNRNPDKPRNLAKSVTVK
jgi:glutamine---fructose-6-phosphate transaminase (isomerizing)